MMSASKLPSLGRLFLLAGVFFATACSPKFDWRDARGSDAPYTILMPGKPLSDSKDLQLEGVSLKMHMLAAEVEGISFAVGSTKVDDAAKAGQIMAAMKNGMIKNIQGTSDSTKTIAPDMVEVRGKLGNGTPVLMVGRFLTHGPWVYQVILLGQEKNIKPEVIDTFMTSFKAN